MSRTKLSAVPRVLVVDDEPDLRDLVELTLVRMGLDVDSAASVAEARTKLAASRYDLCLTDMRLGDGSGLDVLAEIDGKAIDLPVAVITAFGSADNAVAALKAGAFDYISKPIGLDQLRTLVKSALDLSGVATSGGVGAQAGGRSGRNGDTGREIIGNAPAFDEVRALIGKVAKSLAPVHITGESGSGKELAARSIHDLGTRAAKPFVAVNCGAIPETLMESEFFGYRKGAFTGADQDREGFFQVASGGTLFLDEVADLPLAMQVKLLRVIQEKRVRKVGATAEEQIDVRLISATHKSLSAAVEAGDFRQDLFYRLNVIEVRMPSLRECSEDVGPMAKSLLARISGGAATLTPAAARALEAYNFPGNVRELENILERALALASGESIDVDDLRLVPLGTGSLATSDASLVPPAGTDPALAAWLAKPLKSPLQDYLDLVERVALEEALQATRYNRTQAAGLLGLTFRSLRYRLKRLGIE